MNLYFNRSGEPIDMDEWARLSEDPVYTRVARDEVGGCEVSTVWLGSNHGFGSVRLVIFETMVFGGPLNGRQWRHSTEEQAQAGHVAALEEVRQALNPNPPGPQPELDRETTGEVERMLGEETER